MTRPCLALLLLFACVGPLAAQQPWVDPRLRLLEMRPVEPAAGAGEDVVESPGEHPGLRPLLRSPLSVRRGPAGAAQVGLMVELRHAGALADLRAAGAEVGRVIGRIATVRAPLDALPALMRMPSLARIEAARPLELHNDSAVSTSRVDEVRRRIGPAFLGSTGRGVILGVIDTGLDYTHPDFLDEDGEPRTLLIWDQVTGAVCDHERLRAGACNTSDRIGHGTHVTGTAAGDGSAAGADSASMFRYAGVAPEADILAVRFSFDEQDLVEGVAWMFEKADSIGRPAVVNISLGTQVGPHDGTSLIEQALDSLSGPGRIVVTSAGNDGNARNTSPRLLQLLIHARATVEPGGEQVLSFRISDYRPSTASCNDFVLLDMWHGAEQRITYTVERPDGSRVTGSTGESVADDSPAGRVLLLAPESPYPGNGDRNALIELSGCGGSGSPAPGQWILRFSSTDAPTEPLDLWIAAYALGSGGYAYGQSGFDNRMTVGTPATARRLVSVGAYASRLCWPTPTTPSTCTSDVFGFTQPLGDIAFFSSAGPTRDGRLKPEITAPGMLVMATRSRAMSVPGQLLAPSREHRVEMGTSMSSPHVAGAIALLLQHAPGLTPEDAVAIITATAATDDFTRYDHSDGSTGLPNEQWGYGKLDARAALERLVDPAVATELWLSVRSDTLPLGATLPIRGMVINAFGDSLAPPASWSSSDPAVATVSQEGVVTPRSLGTATITASGSGFAETVFVEVVPPATLIVEAAPLPPPETARSSRAGTRIPLLDLRLVVDGFEGVLVDTLGFALTGRDPAASLLLVHDLDDDGVPDADEAVLADTTLALTGDSTVVLFNPDLVVAAQDTLDLVVALELSGAVPHGATFQAFFLPERTSSEGIRSGELDRRTDPAAVVASATTGTTVLAEGEMFALSENPIRSDARRLVLNFGAPPAVAAIYTLRGARVVDLMPLLEPSGARVEWDLRTDGGGVVAPGVYFLVVRIGDGLVRRKLIVARAFGGGDE